MELSLASMRRFNQIITQASDELVEELFAPYEVSIYPTNKLLAAVDNKCKGKWSTKEFRSLWATIETTSLLNSWLTIFKVQKMEITLSSLKKQIKQLQIPSNKLILQQLSTDPKIFMISQLLYGKRTLVDRASVSEPLRDTIYWLPELGVILASINSDDYGSSFKNNFAEQICGKMQAFRVRSLVISKFFNETKMVTRLDVNAEYQITGFQGLSMISFEGDHVRLGLAGLHKRQDIRVHLDQVGPNVGVASENLQLKIGPQVKVKNFKGFEELAKLIE